MLPETNENNLEVGSLPDSADARVSAVILPSLVSGHLPSVPIPSFIRPSARQSLSPKVPLPKGYLSVCPRTMTLSHPHLPHPSGPFSTSSSWFCTDDPRWLLCLTYLGGAIPALTAESERLLELSPPPHLVYSRTAGVPRGRGMCFSWHGHLQCAE